MRGLYMAGGSMVLNGTSVSGGRVARSTAWPLPDTQWTRFFLDAANKTLGPNQPHNMASATYPALSKGVTFSTAPWGQDVEIVGPVKAKLFVSSSTRDMDIFATV